MAQTPEGKVKNQVRKVLDKYEHQGLFYFFPASNGFGRAGVPDIIACAAGQFVGIEVKANRQNKPTALQVRCADEIQRSGGHWFLVYDALSLTILDNYLTALYTKRRLVGC